MREIIFLYFLSVIIRPNALEDVTREICRYLLSNGKTANSISKLKEFIFLIYKLNVFFDYEQKVFKRYPIWSLIDGFYGDFYVL